LSGPRQDPRLLLRLRGVASNPVNPVPWLGRARVTGPGARGSMPNWRPYRARSRSHIRRPVRLTTAPGFHVCLACSDEIGSGHGGVRARDGRMRPASIVGLRFAGEAGFTGNHQLCLVQRQRGRGDGRSGLTREAGKRCRKTPQGLEVLGPHRIQELARACVAVRDWDAQAMAARAMGSKTQRPPSSAPGVRGTGKKRSDRHLGVDAVRYRPDPGRVPSEPDLFGYPTAA
jgi:hypothetical protein